jgi:hypothetical protein
VKCNLAMCSVFKLKHAYASCRSMTSELYHRVLSPIVSDLDLKHLGISCGELGGVSRPASPSLCFEG